MNGIRLLAMLSAAVISAAPLTVSAEPAPRMNLPVTLLDNEEDPEGSLVYYNRDSGLVLPAYFVIPSEFEGKPVYGIADDGFSGVTELVHVKIPGSVLLIGKHSFGSCSNLKQVDFSTGLIGIDDFAFDYCYALESIDLPDSVTNLGQSAFTISGIKSVRFSPNLAVMGTGCFSACDNLTEVTLPASLKTVGTQTFRNCKNLKNATVEGPVCPEQTFCECPALESVTFLDRNCDICSYGTTVCNEMITPAKGVYNGVIRGYVGSTAQAYAELCNYRFEPLDPETPPEIDYSNQPAQFGADHRYTEDGVCYEYMGDHVAVRGFVSGQVPETLVIPWNVSGVSVTEIGENAFAGMTGVQFVTVPMSVTEIGAGAFTECPDLKEIRIFNPDAQISTAGTVFSNDPAGNFSGVLCGYVPSDLKGYATFREMIFLELDQVKGDTMLDGIVSIEDAQLTLRYYTEIVSGKTPAMNKIQKNTADVDGSQTISVEDAQLILKYYTERSVAGKNTTWDDLLKGVTV